MAKKRRRKSKKPRVGTGARHRALTRKLRARGARNPKALAAHIGRKKYGKKRYAKMAAKGRRRKSRRRKR